MPAYNAETTLMRTVAELDRQIVDEIVLVDDASTDQIVALAHKLGLEPIRHERNLGYGGNQKTCCRRALGLHALHAPYAPQDQQGHRAVRSSLRPQSSAWGERAQRRRLPECPGSWSTARRVAPSEGCQMITRVKMTGRRTFFSFHYKLDVWRAANIRNAGRIDPRAAAGWTDASLWEAAKARGPLAVMRLIEEGLKGTSVTVVLIGAETSKRRWVNYEIRRSYERGNGVIGVRIHNVLNQNRQASSKGDIPKLLSENRAPIYDYNGRRHRRSSPRCTARAAFACPGGPLGMLMSPVSAITVVPRKEPVLPQVMLCIWAPCCPGRCALG
jgi:hypothetical protein